MFFTDGAVAQAPGNCGTFIEKKILGVDCLTHKYFICDANGNVKFHILTGINQHRAQLSFLPFFCTHWFVDNAALM